MKITSLGHSAFLLEMETRDGAEFVRILDVFQRRERRYGGLGEEGAE